MDIPHTKKEIIAGIGFAVLATLIWSGNFIIARGVIKEIPPVTLAFYRWLCATLILMPIAGKKISFQWQQFKIRPLYFLVAAITGVSMFNTFVYIAGHYSPAINLALIGTTTSPIISVFLAAVFLKEKVSLLRIVGMAVCVVGILLLLSKGSFDILLTLSFSKGDWWMLAAAAAFAVYNVMVRKKPAALDATSFLFFVFLTGTIILAPFYINELSHVGGFSINLRNLSVILYLGLGTSVICFLLWNIAIARLGAGRTSLFGNLIPVFSSIEAVLILGEKITPIHLFSFLLVAIGLVIANLQKRN